MTALGSLLVGFEHTTFVELATISAMPLIAAALFLRALDVVVTITLTGWVANTLLFSRLGWPTADVLSVCLRMAIGAGVLVLASWDWRRQRSVDLELEAAQGLALRRSENRSAQAERLAIVGRLALSREYAESFKGSLTGENATPAGAIFTLSLPIARAS